jgi:hypothetical protein
VAIGAPLAAAVVVVALGSDPPAGARTAALVRMRVLRLLSVSLVLWRTAA